MAEGPERMPRRCIHILTAMAAIAVDDVALRAGLRSRGSANTTAYTRSDLFTRALSAAKEAAAELEGLHKAGVVPKGSQDILAMVKAEIEELEGGT